MTQHLSGRQIAMCLAGAAPAAEMEHTLECASCRGEVEQFLGAVSLFRGSVRNWSGSVGGIRYRTVAATHLDCLLEPSALIGLYGRQKRSWLLSLAFQTALVALLFTAMASPTIQQAAQRAVELYTPVSLSAYKPRPQQGGGGGGDRSPLPASQGKLPKPALKQFTPPSAVVNNPDPKLAMDPSILAPPDVPLPQVAMNNYGDPLAKALGTLSNGSGSGGGIGSGTGTGVGAGKGPGVGLGQGGGFGAGVFKVGGGVTAPVALYRVEPEYSEEARKAKYQGVVVLSVVIDASGRVLDPRVIQSLGLGLDERAIEAVKKWKFKPGYKDGRPVAVMAQIEVSFRLL